MGLGVARQRIVNGGEDGNDCSVQPAPRLWLLEPVGSLLQQPENAHFASCLTDAVGIEPSNVVRFVTRNKRRVARHK